MAVPKKKTSKSRRDMRRSHHALKFTAAAEVCDACAELKLRHRVCMTCGDFKGVKVLNLGHSDAVSD